MFNPDRPNREAEGEGHGAEKPPEVLPIETGGQGEGLELKHESPKRVQEKIKELKEKVEKVLDKEIIDIEAEERKLLFGDFVGAERNKEGKIVLTQEQKKETNRAIEELKREKRFSPPSLLKGALTATEYDSKVRNFSTRTAIVTLEDGRKVFAVYNYPASWIHRLTDAIAKRLAGDRMSKASSSKWKETFESRSNIPIIDCDDENVVLMPYLPNINAHDLFARNKEIKEEGGDFGPCPFAGEVSLEDKLQIGEQIICALEAVHKQGKAWGETILPNMIVTPERMPIIVDPETQYDKDIRLSEQKARDLRDILMSICGALHYSERANNYQEVVGRLLSQYSDKGVVEELKRVVSIRPTFVQRFFRKSYETARLGISVEEYQKVVEAIKNYGVDNNSNVE